MDGTTGGFEQGKNTIRTVLQAVVIGRVDWTGGQRGREAGHMDPSNFPSRWKGGTNVRSVSESLIWIWEVVRKRKTHY